LDPDLNIGVTVACFHVHPKILAFQSVLSCGPFINVAYHGLNVVKGLNTTCIMGVIHLSLPSCLFACNWPGKFIFEALCPLTMCCFRNDSSPQGRLSAVRRDCKCFRISKVRGGINFQCLFETFA
jgi:hypothetical protein